MKRKKPTAYIDANIFSVQFYQGNDLTMRFQKMTTLEWWGKERNLFELMASSMCEGELARGKYRGQKRALALVRRVNFLPMKAGVRRCSELYLEEGLVPESKPGDAVHLALATVYNVDYLLTWNHAHLANVHVQERLHRLNKRQGWRTPLLVSPETIPWALYGQEIRRLEDEEG